MKNEKDLVVEGSEVKEVPSVAQLVETAQPSAETAQPVSTQDDKTLEEILEKAGLPLLPPQHAFFVLHTSKGIRVESIAEWWKSYLRGYRRFNIQFDIRNTPLDRRAINIDTIRQVTRVNKPYIKKVLWDWLGWKYIRGKWGHEYEEYYLEIYKDEISGYDKVFGYEFKDHIDEYSIEVVASLLSSAWFTPERGEENWEEKVIEEVKRNLL